MQQNRVLAYELATPIDLNSLKDISGGQMGWHLTSVLTGGLNQSATEPGAVGLHVDERFDS